MEERSLGKWHFEKVDKIIMIKKKIYYYSYEFIFNLELGEV
jgi:hypothetical protein